MHSHSSKIYFMDIIAANIIFFRSDSNEMF